MKGLFFIFKAAYIIPSGIKEKKKKNMPPKLGWTISRKARTPVLTGHISKLAALAGSLLP